EVAPEAGEPDGALGGERAEVVAVAGGEGEVGGGLGEAGAVVRLAAAAVLDLVVEVAREVAVGLERLDGAEAGEVGGLEADDVAAHRDLDAALVRTGDGLAVEGAGHAVGRVEEAVGRAGEAPAADEARAGGGADRGEVGRGEHAGRGPGVAGEA